MIKMVYSFVKSHITMGSLSNNVKESLRLEFLTKRKGLSQKRREEANSHAFEKLQTLVEGYECVMSYSSLESEVCTGAFNVWLAQQNRLCLPRIESSGLVPCMVTDVEKDLKTFSHRFQEPDFSCPRAEKIDLVITKCLMSNARPRVVFDKNGGRIGFGKGHYDKFLERAKIPSIGLCFSEQIYEEPLPLEKHDIVMESLCIV